MEGEDKDKTSNKIKSRCLYFIEILKNLEIKNQENLKQVNMSDHLVKILFNINCASKLRKIIRGNTRQMEFDNITPAKTYGNKTQKKQEIFNLTYFNQNSLEAINKFYLIYNEKFYSIDEAKKEIKNVIREII